MEVKSKNSALASIRSAPSTDVLRDTVNKLLAQKEEIEQRLRVLKSGSIKPVSSAEKQQVESEWKRWRRTREVRKRGFLELEGMLLDSGIMKREDLWVSNRQLPSAGTRSRRRAVAKAKLGKRQCAWVGLARWEVWALVRWREVRNVCANWKCFRRNLVWRRTRDSRVHEKVRYEVVMYADLGTVYETEGSERRKMDGGLRGGVVISTRRVSLGFGHMAEKAQCYAIDSFTMRGKEAAELPKSL